MKNTGKTGIYYFYWKNNPHTYVGSSAVKFYTRWNGNYNNFIKNTIKKYGSQEKLILELVEREDGEGDDSFKERLLSREQFYLDLLSPDLNIAKVAGNNLGIKFSEEAKRKQSVASLGIKKSKTHCINISKGRKGISFSDSHKAALKAASAKRGDKGRMRGDAVTSETRAKLSAVHKGKTVSEETRKKLSKALKGKKRVMTEEARLLRNKRVSEALTGRKRLNNARI